MVFFKKVCYYKFVSESEFQSMTISFSKEEIIKTALSPYDYYCTGYPGKGNYFTALVMAIGTFKKSFSHSGSDILDKIVAYDRAEVDETYIGQINMSLVSSFCGPQGLIWGYDIARKEDNSLIFFSSNFQRNLKELKGIKIKNGKNLRKAALALFGTNKERHFPFLPGTHVPCAGRIYPKSGPTILYGTIAIGIPENRKRAACVIMEDVGEIIVESRITRSIKEKLMLNAVKSVIEIAKNQKVRYREIFVDFIARKIESDEMGCVLIAVPYFLLAKKAFDERLPSQSLEKWIENTRRYWLCNQHFS